MLIQAIYGGFVSQMKGFYMAYKLAYHRGDELVLDVSSFYEGYKYPFFLDCFDIPVCTKIAFRGKEHARIENMSKYYKQEICIIKNGDELEAIYKNYNCQNIYYIIYDSAYDDFLYRHQEYSFLYVGNDELTNKIMEMLELPPIEHRLLTDFGEQGIENVGVHIRLTDFVEIGWTVHEDLDFFPAAIQWMREHLNNARFYVFSDDICQAKNLLGYAEDVIYVESDRKKEHGTDLEEFLLLSRCKHKILTKKSTYSWFSAVVGCNKWKADGYTLMIEHLHVNLSQENQIQVENVFNGFKGIFQKKDLPNCILLSDEEIHHWSARYISEKCGEKNSADKLEDIAIIHIPDKTFLFLTYQSYSQWVICGMQHMAKIVAAAGNKVYFVGTGIKYTDQGDDNIDWTIQHKEEAFDDLNCSLGYEIFPYAQLNARNSYKQFVEYISSKDNNTLYVIARKPCVFRSCEKMKNIKLIFIDFSDVYEAEKSKVPEAEEVGYMYKTADLVVTYDYETYMNYETELKGKIIFVDISKLYPAQISFSHKLNNFREVQNVEQRLYEKVYNKIIEFFAK